MGIIDVTSNDVYTTSRAMRIYMTSLTMRGYPTWLTFKTLLYPNDLSSFIIYLCNMKGKISLLYTSSYLSGNYVAHDQNMKDFTLAA